jgi:hypothetical protein
MHSPLSARATRLVSRLAALGFVVASVAGAQAPGADARKRDGVVSGVVTNLNGISLSKVEVFIVNTDLKTMTNDSGVFEFPSAPTGKVRLIARRIGFEPTERSVNLESNKQKQLDFELKAIPEMLDSVLVSDAGGMGRLGEFWSRRMTGNGAYITPADIERRRPQKPSDLLRSVTGVRVIMGDGALDHPVILMGRLPVLANARSTGIASRGADCRVTYYVDGNYVAPGTFHMDDMSASSLEAIEVYRGPAETPARFRQRDTACGVIVIWTRDPSRRAPGS